MAKAPRQTSSQLRAKKERAGEDPIERKLDAENRELALATGTVTKDKVYYKKLEAVIESKRDHPKHHNVRMQAHHIVSEKSVKLAGTKYINELILLGYNINDLENLAFIPSTLQGACHLDVQPHIGNHSASTNATSIGDEPKSYKDDSHPSTYHEIVKTALIERLDKLRDECPSTHPGAPAQAKHQLHLLSRQVLTLISTDPKKAPLTNAYRSFSHESKVGCGGEPKIIKAKFLGGQLQACPVERDHSHDRHGERQAPEEISYPKKGKYELEPGK